MNSKILALALLLAVVFLASPSVEAGNPLHASCKLTWNFPGQNCTSVQNHLVTSIKDMDNENCGSSQKCLYKLKSSASGSVKATHTTPKKRYVDDLSFTLSANGDDCQVQAYSTSEIWYAVLGKLMSM